jgi:hypothetical protein
MAWSRWPRRLGWRRWSNRVAESLAAYRAELDDYHLL